MFRCNHHHQGAHYTMSLLKLQLLKQSIKKVDVSHHEDGSRMFLQKTLRVHSRGADILGTSSKRINFYTARSNVCKPLLWNQVHVTFL
jgi:hypothetical protein